MCVLGTSGLSATIRLIPAVKDVYADESGRSLMGKLVLLILIGVIAYLFFKGMGRSAGSGGQSARRGTREAEHMRTCAHCGVHFPESEGVRADGKFFCSDEHRRLAG